MSSGIIALKLGFKGILVEGGGVTIHRWKLHFLKIGIEEEGEKTMRNLTLNWAAKKKKSLIKGQKHANGPAATYRR